MKGWRMLAWGLAMAVMPAGLSYLAGVDWTQYVNPTWAMAISGVVTIALRVVTTTAIFQRE